jgi:hypothetical protein
MAIAGTCEFCHRWWSIVFGFTYIVRILGMVPTTTRGASGCHHLSHLGEAIACVKSTSMLLDFQFEIIISFGSHAGRSHFPRPELTNLVLSSSLSSPPHVCDKLWLDGLCPIPDRSSFRNPGNQTQDYENYFCLPHVDLQASTSGGNSSFL